jgi:hypothetical protein
MKNLLVIILLASATMSQLSAQSESCCYPCPPDCCELTCASNAQAGVNPEATFTSAEVAVTASAIKATKCSASKGEAEVQTSKASIGGVTVNTGGICCPAGQKAKAENDGIVNADTPAATETHLRFVPKKR